MNFLQQYDRKSNITKTVFVDDRRKRNKETCMSEKTNKRRLTKMLKKK